MTCRQIKWSPSKGVDDTTTVASLTQHSSIPRYRLTGLRAGVEG